MQRRKTQKGKKVYSLMFFLNNQKKTRLQMQNSLVQLMIDDHFVGSPFENYWGMIKSNQGYGFPVVMYGCETWTVKKAERRRIDAF